MRIIRALLALATLSLPALAAEYHLELKPETTKITWTVGTTLHTVHGTFKLKSGVIDFDGDAGKASGQVVVDVTSGNSDSDGRDRKMHDSVLESAKYPDATFVPSRVEGTLAAAGASNVKVHGTFTIHGAAHDMTMAVSATITADQIHATIEFDVPWFAWGMKDPGNFLLKVNKTAHFSIDASGPLQKR